MLTAGLRCAPDTRPMKRMIPITISPGATTAAVRVMVSGERLAHHSAAGGDEHEEERAEELGEEPAPFLVRVVEVLDPFPDGLVGCLERRSLVGHGVS